MLYAGQRPLGSLVVVPFNTFDPETGENVTVTGVDASKVRIYKNGGTTPRASASGITVLIDHASVVGRHLVLIDLSDDDDAGFYTAAASYQVAVDDAEVEGATVEPWIGTFDLVADFATLTDMQNQIWNANQNSHNTADSMALLVKNLHNLLTANVEGSHDIPAILRLLLAACCGKALGLQTTTASYRNLADTKTRIAATIDEHGNRLTVTLDAS